ncbi:hypothetical protein [Allorhodopirellula heiligendammensis]|uniref:Uncharacterized protein n=1 Tax=Allorhodopirellula heiligendammensis TaxID=2714739 RepID=A0A5C6B5L8_9BACT|nr:hypothetical protein [Allorhodopirellula heiligendammensis]TWU07403.1 hypothetical protein Poly21_55810 [Allorhodopirellula heiligendammensis]
MNRQFFISTPGLAALLGIIAAAVPIAHAQESGVPPVEPSFTQGEAQSDISTLFEWKGENPRTANIGTIRSDDGVEWTVPAKTHFGTAMKAPDLYNEANAVTPDRVADVNLAQIPVIDAGGDEVFTAYIFGDNYFEFYVNGNLLAVDPIPMTPFNSSVIRFKAQRPFTIGIMGVDWEERLGLGFEKFRGAVFHQGDAGLVAVVKDESEETVAVTDQSWKAQTFYTSPLKSKECLVLKGPWRDSSNCGTDDVDDGTSHFAAHWPIPDDWAAADFDDRDWPNAVTYTNDFVGVENKPAYTNFTDLFDNPSADAKFIWSSSLVHDNLVLLRTTIER